MANAVCGCVAQAYLNDVHMTQRKHFAAEQATDNNNLRARLEDINATLSADEAQNAEPQSA